MLKTAKLKKSGDGVGSDNRAGRVGSKIDSDEVDGGEVEVDKVGKKVQKKTKSKNLSKSKKTIGSSDFLILGAKLAFTKFRQAFLKAPMLYHFDPERHIRIETDVLGYAIGGVLSQLTSEGQWYPVAFISRRMILVETRYKTHDGELLAIIEAFKSWRHYLEDS